MKRRWLWLVAIAFGVILLLTLVAAPSNGKLNSGSTYSRSPDGYGAWYKFIQKQGIPIKRWQKPFQDLPGVESDDSLKKSSAQKTANQPTFKPSKSLVSNPITLLRINMESKSYPLNYYENKWVEKGNILIILGFKEPVTKADFITYQESVSGKVKIETRRRHSKLQDGEKKLLSDRFGAVVWEEKIGKGRIIFAATPHLAANAYQNEVGNYKFLAQLVTQSLESEPGKSETSAPKSKVKNSQLSQIFVDEYIHGYKDKKPKAKTGEDDVLTYLAKTPLASAFLQAFVILIVLVIAKNRRLGLPLPLTAPVVNNSEAYIQAIAGVLQKAESSKFVVEVIGKEEQLQLQKALGLGQTLLDQSILIAAWVQQTGRPASELAQVLQLPSKKRTISESDLLSWLDKWQTIRYYAIQNHNQ